MDRRMLTDHLHEGTWESEEVSVWGVCDYCEEDIFDGDGYYDVDTTIVCEDCMRGFYKTVVLD